MLGNTGLFVDRRLAFWLSAMYATLLINQGLGGEGVAFETQVVFAQTLDEMDIIEENTSYQYN